MSEYEIIIKKDHSVFTGYEREMKEGKKKVTGDTPTRFGVDAPPIMNEETTRNNLR